MNNGVLVTQLDQETMPHSRHKNKIRNQERPNISEEQSWKSWMIQSAFLSGASFSHRWRWETQVFPHSQLRRFDEFKEKTFSTADHREMWVIPLTFFPSVRRIVLLALTPCQTSEISCRKSTDAKIRISMLTMESITLERKKSKGLYARVPWLLLLSAVCLSSRNTLIKWPLTARHI